MCSLKPLNLIRIIRHFIFVFDGVYLQIPSNGKRKPKNEFKDDFKCNPFDSSQQIAMYLALREIFHVPAGSFLVISFTFL